MRPRIGSVFLVTLALFACSDQKKEAPTTPEPEAAPIATPALPVAEKLTAPRPEDIETLKTLPNSQLSMRQAIPPRCEFVLSSPDAEAWREAAAKRAYVQKLMKSPLFAELKASGAWQRLEAAERTLLSASKLAIHPGDGAALFAGPTAFALCTGGAGNDDRYRYWVWLKQLKGAEPNALRLAANVARAVKRLKVKPMNTRVDVPVYEVHGIGVVLYGDLLAFTDAPERLFDKLRPRTEGQWEVPPPLMPDSPGLHLGFSPNGSQTGLAAAGISFPIDPAAPMRVRIVSNRIRSKAQLLKYAPADAIAGISPSRAMFDSALSFLNGAFGQLEELQNQPSALILGARPSAAHPEQLGPLLVVAHEDRAGALKLAKKILKKMNKKPAQRTRTPEGDSLLSPDGPGMAIAVTEDALLISLSQDSLRAALAAGHGKAGSLGDKIKAELEGDAPGIIYFDTKQLSDFLSAFYDKTLPKAPQVKDSLRPSFSALGEGGAWVAALKGPIMEGPMPYMEGELRELK